MMLAVMGAAVVGLSLLPRVLPAMNAIPWWAPALLLIGIFVAVTANQLIKVRLGYYSIWYVGLAYFTAVTLLQALVLPAMGRPYSYGNYEGTWVAPLIVGLMFLFSGGLLYLREIRMVKNIDKELMDGDTLAKAGKLEEAMKHYDKAIRAAHVVAPPSSVGEGKQSPVEGYETPWLSKWPSCRQTRHN